MQIAFLNIYGGKVSRGAETAVYELAKRLSKEHKVTIFQSERTANVPYHVERISGIPFVSTDVSNSTLLRILKKFYLDPYSLLTLYFSLRCLPKLLTHHFDILIPINGFWQILMCKIVKFFKGGKIVVMGYAGIGADDYINLLLKPDAFFAMTKVAAKWAKKVNRGVYVGVVPGGVDRQLFNPRVTPLKLSLKHPIILTVAALVPYKRVDLVIQAVSKLPQVSLIVAGTGPLRQEIETLGRGLLGKRFLQVDLDYDQLPSLYTACDVFTLPSLHTGTSLFTKITRETPSEAFGIVYVEAMACGLPVVAPNDALRREIVGEGGILVNCTNIDEYATALKQALTKKWGATPQRQAEKFEWERIASDFSNALKKL